MLHRSPREVPPLVTLLEDLGRPSAKQLGKALGVSERTARSYIKREHAPKAVLLALFWVTRWGQQWVHTDAHNDAVHFYSVAMSLQRKNEQLEAVLSKLLQEARFSSANDPVTLEGVSLRDRTLLLRNSAPVGSEPMRVTIPNAGMRYAKR